jgi:hypothetical protein
MFTNKIVASVAFAIGLASAESCQVTNIESSDSFVQRTLEFSECMQSSARAVRTISIGIDGVVLDLYDRCVLLHI